MSRRHMKVTEEIKHCKTPAEAIMLLAQRIDALEAQLAEQPADPWQQPLEWSQLQQWADAPAATASATPYVPPGVRPATPSEVDAEIQAVQAQLVDCTNDEEREALNAKLRLLRDEGKSLTSAVPEGQRPRISDDVVDFEAVTPERMAARAGWATEHKLWEFLPLGPAETVKAFAKGGPMWLYLGNREAVMAMPFDWRQWLVTEVHQDSPAAAQEMGRDILKDEGTGVDSGTAVEYTDQVSRS